MTAPPAPAAPAVPAEPPAATPRPRWSLVLLLAVLGIAAAVLAKSPCLASYETETGAVALDWRDGRQYTWACYSDTIPLYGLERLQDGELPYKTSWTDEPGGRDRYMEYPVITGMLQYVVMLGAKDWIEAFGNPASPDPPEVVVYFLLMAVVLALAWLAAVAATAPLLGRRRAQIAVIALSPLVVVHLFTNFDALAVALAAGGMLAWTRRRPGLAGLLLGLGAAAKLYPLLLLGPLLVLCWRAGKLRPWLVATAAAGTAAVLVNLPVALLYPRGWWEFFRLNSTRPADHDSIWFAARFFTAWQGFDGPRAAGEPPQVLNLVTLLLFALVCLAVAVVAMTAPRRPRFAALAFLVIAGFLLTNKVWSPQYSLWLVPLAVLALARWKTVLAWATIDAAVWYPRMLYFRDWNEDATRTFLQAVLIRDAVVLLLCAIVVRDIYRPDRDPVRRDGEDDPCGGPLDGAPDVVTGFRRRPAPEPDAGGHRPDGPVPARADRGDQAPRAALAAIASRT